MPGEGVVCYSFPRILTKLFTRSSVVIKCDYKYTSSGKKLTFTECLLTGTVILAQNKIDDFKKIV